MTAFTVIRKVDLPAEKVWQIIGDFKTSPGPNILVTVEEQGDPANHSLGAIRSITIGKVRVRERLESIEPPKSFTYRILSGAPMKDHCAKVELIAEGPSTTEIRWNVEFTPKFLGIGWLVGRITRKAVNGFIDELAKAAR